MGRQPSINVYSDPSARQNFEFIVRLTGLANLSATFVRQVSAAGAAEAMVPLIFCEELARPKADATGLEGNTIELEFPNTFVVPEVLDLETRPASAFPGEGVVEAAVGSL